MRQNSKYLRHAGKRRETPVIQRRAAKVLGKLLIALPGVTPMLGEIRKQFDIPQADAWDDINEMLAPGGGNGLSRGSKSSYASLTPHAITARGDRP